jgi:diguanylate cyclase (GGDEF)-like protein
VEQTWKLSDRLREVVGEEAVTHGDKQIRATMSLGIAVSEPGLSVGADALLLAADAALYRAKTAGRDRVEIAAAPRALAVSLAAELSFHAVT